jgi:hypothetical protein
MEQTTPLRSSTIIWAPKQGVRREAIISVSAKSLRVILMPASGIDTDAPDILCTVTDAGDWRVHVHAEDMQDPVASLTLGPDVQEVRTAQSSPRDTMAEYRFEYATVEVKQQLTETAFNFITEKLMSQPKERFKEYANFYVYECASEGQLEGLKDYLSTHNIKHKIDITWTPTKQAAQE